MHTAGLKTLLFCPSGHLDWTMSHPIIRVLDSFMKLPYVKLFQQFKIRSS